MYTVIKGVYENGEVKFLEPAPDIDKSEVLITFLNSNEKNQIPKRKLGGLLDLQHLKGKNLSIPDDFNAPLDDLKNYM
ncbi:MAG: hypothetical protein ABIP95_04805 [Pelobium sp.]